MNELRENRFVKITTIQEFEKLRETVEADNRSELLAGKIPPFEGPPPQARPNELGDTEVLDADGEVVSIKDLNLVMSGSIDGEPMPLLKPELMKDFTVAVMRTTTFAQRNLPIRKKILVMWHIFRELFFGKLYLTYANVRPNKHMPYLVAAETWVRNQQKPIPFKVKAKILFKRIRDLFVFKMDSEKIETYGMPGFQPRKVSLDYDDSPIKVPAHLFSKKVAAK